MAESKTMDIIYNNIKTKTFFYPSKTKWFKFSREDLNLNLEPAGIKFPKAKGDKTKYSISYYEMNLEGQAFKDMLRQSDDFSYDYSNPIDYDRINWVVGEFYVRDKEKFILSRGNFYELYKKRAEIIYDRFTQLPDTLPIRVKELAHVITKEEDTRYDKLKAIEAYLMQYEYSHTPGKKPEEADFIDYFLFDNKKGYCTSFATAMAVLGRSIGIPTRYVEGFAVNYEDKDDLGFLVRNSNAHAWVEAYFDGVGWIPFEATPPFYEERYSEWAPRKKYEDDGNRYQDIPEMIPPMMGITDFNATRTAKDDGGRVLLWILIIICMLLALVIILIAYYLISKRRYRKEFDASDYNKKMYLLFLRILTLLRYEGFTLISQDTLLTLSERIKDRYQYEGIGFIDIVNIFMAYRYGEVDVTDKQCDKMTTFYEGLMRAHEHETKALKLHMEEFLFLVKGYSHSANY
ncbi:MAG: transglutaminase-like domain-containing protein, partial [Herbinix sp.]|nr:transglutaminase-like domain-containing protein [Herbinix sp.]